MARFFTALLAAAAMLQVGSAAPYPYTNGTAPAPRSLSGAVNSTASPEVLKRRLREYPIALGRWATSRQRPISSIELTMTPVKTALAVFQPGSGSPSSDHSI
ncbi:hypothetical protein F5Y11DRAFT_345572 [Daldinia sp. FL1419]|nr:hypothetical protein F5Y11DRAFT_345572 [Daldinia sp. FL1419]